MKLLATIRSMASKPGAVWRIAAVSLLLNSFAIPTGFVLDDSFHALALGDGSGHLGTRRAPWDAFAFAKDPRTVKSMIDGGIYPWWSDLQARFAFLRPLTSLTLFVDHSLWPDWPAAMHVHSLLWYAVLLLSVGLVYRRYCESPAIAALAFAVYALDDARAATAGWIASRGALIALSGGFVSLLAHHRWRRCGQQRWLWAALFALAMGLAGAEAAVQALGYLVAYALLLDDQSLARRVLSLLPYGVLIVAWRVVYLVLGYGAARTDLYIDPASNPLYFLRQAAQRMLALLTAQFAGIPNDLVDVLKYAAPDFAWVYLPVAVLAMGVLAWLLSGLLRADAKARFWALGSVLSTLPVCAVMPADRLLSATALGGSALTAHLLMAVVEGRHGYRGPLTRAATIALAGMSLVIAPIMLPLRAYSHVNYDRYLEPADASIPSGAEVTGQTVVILNPPNDEYGIYQPLLRAARGGTMPKRSRWLATGESALDVTRVDEMSLRIRPVRGFLPEGSIWTLRSRAHPSAVGDRMELPDVAFVVTEVTADGRPAEVLARFDLPLDSDAFVWLQWGGPEGYVPFELPGPGRRVRVPEIDPRSVFEAL